MFSLVISFLTKIGLIVLGIVMKLSNDKNNKFGVYKKYWYIYVILGILLILYKIYKLKFS